jgi:hypothetical protein
MLAIVAKAVNKWLHFEEIGVDNSGISYNSKLSFFYIGQNVLAHILSCVQ